MKLATIALASAFALSSTFAFAYRPHHVSGVTTHHGTVGMNSARTHRGSMNYYGGNGRAGGSNSRGGLVGGADPGTYKP
jgi:hypothetical protein